MPTVSGPARAGRARLGLGWPRALWHGRVGLRGANIRPQPAPGMFAGGETKASAGLGAARAYPQLVLLCLRAARFPPGFSPPLAFVSLRFLLVHQSPLVSTRFGGAQSPAGAVALCGGFTFAGCKGRRCNGVPSASTANSPTTSLHHPQLP